MLRFRRDALRMAVFLFTAVVCCFIAEGIARLVAPYSISHPWVDRFDGIVAPSPNAHGRHFVPGSYDTTFSFNSQRFRGRQTYTSEPDPQVTRIAILGSSAAYGSGANDDETYPVQLQSILQQRYRQPGSRRSFEVINAAIPGTVVAEQVLWYRNWVSQFHPQVVVLNITCAVDYLTGMFILDASGQVTPRTSAELQAANKGVGTVGRLAKSIPGYIFLAEHSELFNLLELKLGEVFRRRRNAALAQDFDSRRPTQTSERAEADALALEAAEVVWLKKQVEASGARLAVVVLPCRENIYSSPTPEAHEIQREYAVVVSALRDAAARNDIPLAEVAPDLRTTAAQSQQPLYYNGRYETHPTPAGYREIARSVATFLLDCGVLPKIDSRTSAGPSSP